MLRRILIVGGVLAAIAIVAPLPPPGTDKDLYERIGRESMIPSCNDLQCFRIGVPWALERLPGDGYFKWRTYAVICQALAAVLMGAWVRRLGAGQRASTQVTWLTALGSGSLFTLYDPYTADPLMHLLGPALMLLVADGRLAVVAAVSAVGVLAKEFAAVPLVVWALMRAQQRRFGDAWRAAIAAAAAIGSWAAWNLFARTAWGYNTLHSPSARLLEGGYLVLWLESLGPHLVVTAIAAVLGALWVLWPAGVHLGPAVVRQLTWAAAGPLLLFNYVQQPDRAMWNFVFAVMPAAAVVLDRIPPALGWTIVALQAAVGVRIGAQLPFVPAVRFTLVAALGAGAFAAWRAYARPRLVVQPS